MIYHKGSSEDNIQVRLIVHIEGDTFNQNSKNDKERNSWWEIL